MLSDPLLIYGFTPYVHFYGIKTNRHKLRLTVNKLVGLLSAPSEQQLVFLSLL